MSRGDHITIAEAIQAANPGDRILVRPGLYQEGLVLDKPLEIIGEAVKNIPQSFRDKYPEIHWRGIAGFRDVLSAGPDRLLVCPLGVRWVPGRLIRNVIGIPV